MSKPQNDEPVMATEVVVRLGVRVQRSDWAKRRPELSQRKRRNPGGRKRLGNEIEVTKRR